ncbi:hypothetical protein JTB14_012760 [Gonioctena quinquepunctata]|nr:hypothetical protein JTB14_012760 [Gonioctena quinquepunctata]
MRNSTVLSFGFFFIVSATLASPMEKSPEQSKYVARKKLEILVNGKIENQTFDTDHSFPEFNNDDDSVGIVIKTASPIDRYDASDRVRQEYEGYENSPSPKNMNYPKKVEQSSPGSKKFSKVQRSPINSDYRYGTPNMKRSLPKLDDRNNTSTVLKDSDETPRMERATLDSNDSSNIEPLSTDSANGTETTDSDHSSPELHDHGNTSTASDDRNETVNDRNETSKVKRANLDSDDIGEIEAPSVNPDEHNETSSIERSSREVVDPKDDLTIVKNPEEVLNEHNETLRVQRTTPDTNDSPTAKVPYNCNETSSIDPHNDSSALNHRKRTLNESSPSVLNEKSSTVSNRNETSIMIDDTSRSGGAVLDSDNSSADHTTTVLNDRNETMNDTNETKIERSSTDSSDSVETKHSPHLEVFRVFDEGKPSMKEKGKGPSLYFDNLTMIEGTHPGHNLSKRNASHEADIPTRYVLAVDMESEEDPDIIDSLEEDDYSLASETREERSAMPLKSIGDGSPLGSPTKNENCENCLEESGIATNAKVLGCMCALFAVEHPTQNDIPLMLKTFDNVSCHQNVLSEDACDKACMESVTPENDLKEDRICTFLPLSCFKFQIFLQSKLCQDDTQWKFTGISTPALICCHMGAAVPC